MEQVEISTFMLNKLDNLSITLHTQGYFGFKEDAKFYVDRIVDFIYTIPTLPKRKCKNSKYGVYFAKYKAPKSKTNYLIIYNFKPERYLIKDVFSNHQPEYAIIF